MAKPYAQHEVDSSLLPRTRACWVTGRRALLVLAMAAVGSGGCTLPQSVMSLSDVQASSSDGGILLIPVTATTMPRSIQSNISFPQEFIDAADYAHNVIGPGDAVKARIYESGAQTVFGNGVGELGTLVVDDEGRLHFPYAGAVRAGGRTLPQLRAEVIGRLRTVVSNPQVDLQFAERRSKLVSVQGQAAKAGTYPIDRGRTRLGELLGEVAPDQKNPHMLNVTVRRGGDRGTVRLADIYRDPGFDIALRPGDMIILDEVIEHVTVLGAVGLQGQVRITRRDASLIDIIGEARGLNDDAADPRAVFLLRPQSAGQPPVVYQFEFRNPGTVALASAFVVRDRDAILISNAPFTQTRKVLQAFSQSFGAVRSATAIMP